MLIHELPNAIKSLKIEKRATVIAELSDRVVFPSSFVHKKFLQFGAVENYLIRPQGLYLTVNHTVDYKRSFKELDKELDIGNRKIVINVATGELRKGFDIFLQIANKLRKEKEILFIWIGSVNEKIYQEVLKGDKSDNLVLYGYVDDASHLAKFYDCADVLLLTSREEPFGSIVLEAFHAGTPVIGFENAGGFIDTVISGKTGELVEYENIDKMVNSLEKLLKDDKTLREYSRNCVELSENYKFDKYVEKIMEIFDER